MKSIIFILIICSFFSACSPQTPSTPTIPKQPSITLEPSKIPTQTLIPSPTPITWQKYRMTYLVKIGGSGKLWMPSPRNWEGVGMRNVSIVDISPTPNDQYQDDQGNAIIFWNRNGSKEYKISFDLELSPIYYSIDPKKIGDYDRNSPDYIRHTQPSSRIESTDPKIIELAKTIVGNETSPYYQAQKIHRWVTKNIDGQDIDGETALSTLEKRSGACGGHSFLFVALLRSLGIPARDIGGLRTDGLVNFTKGDFKEGTLRIHIWSEFYLPNYGWVQSDTAGGDQNFAQINEYRIVMFRGEDILLGHGYPLKTVPWFHMPQTEFIGNSDPKTQNIGEYLRLEVEKE